MKPSKSTSYAAILALAAVLTACALQHSSTYRLYVTSDGNGLVAPTGMVTRPSGTDIRISAFANPGYHFVDWTVDSGSASFASSTSSSTTVDLTGGASVFNGGLYYADIVAHFAPGAGAPTLPAAVTGSPSSPGGSAESLAAALATK